MTQHSLPLQGTGVAGIRATRAVLRARRRAITSRDRRKAAQSLLIRIRRQGWLAPGTKLGLYLSIAEEMDSLALLDAATLAGCQVFLPRVIDYGRRQMGFYSARKPWTRSRYGILEPARGRKIMPSQLDVIFMPLVGFDHLGNRIGMGKGYYDRALSSLQKQQARRRALRRPLLVGLAFGCQQVEALDAQPHDVPLDHVVTERALHSFRRP